MKREFLQNFKVGDQPLPKEIIDAIMAENGNDINAAKAAFADYDTMKEQLAAAQKTITELQKNGTTIEDAQKAAKEWEEKFNEATRQHAAEMAERDFTDRLTAGITKARGKNAKAITALLDVDALKASKNQETDIAAAIEACQKENGYLFGDEGNPPPYSGGAGAGGAEKNYTAAQLEAMSLEDYRKFRSGK